MLGSVSLALAALSTLAASPVVLAAPAVPYDGPHNANNPHREYLKRSITADVAQVNGKTFDFVIVGGGLAGLVVANRLSEWDNQTVLVIEAGGDAQDVLDRVSVPGYAYHQGLSSDTPYGWNFSTSEQVSGS